MNRAEIRETLNRVDSLAHEIENNVSADNGALTDYRADLAGLLVVMTCATYETCVKRVLCAYAGRHSPLFQVYAESKYEKINSRIDAGDLQNYANTFHPVLGNNYKALIKSTQKAYLHRTNVDIKTSYEQLLKWRHSFAHTGSRVTTVEEIVYHHKYAKRVIFAFADSFRNFTI